MSEIKDSLAALAADVESALTRRRSRGAGAISWFREAALLPVLAVLIVAGPFLNSHFLTVSNIIGIGPTDLRARRGGRGVARGYLRAVSSWSR